MEFIKKRYLFFGVYKFYPDGGLLDLRFTFDHDLKDFEEGFKNSGSDEYDFYQAFDTETFEIIHGKDAIIARLKS